MKACDVSVVIPIFNAAAYLNECLDSVLAQSLRDIELLCVDDGSTNASSTILREYAGRDSRLRVLSQTNAGAGTECCAEAGDGPLSCLLRCR